MKYSLSDKQYSELLILFSQAKLKPEDAIGSYSAPLQYVADNINHASKNYTTQCQAHSPLNNPTQMQLWFACSARINAGRGLFSKLFKAYIQSIARLIGLESIENTVIQRALNQVSYRTLSKITSEDNIHNLPSIEEISTIDREITTSLLFGSATNIQNFPTWSGILLFSTLGEAQCWYTDQLDENNLYKQVGVADIRTILARRMAYRYIVNDISPYEDYTDFEILLKLENLRSKIENHNLTISAQSASVSSN